MSLQIIDASVAIKWFVEEDILSHEADAVLEKIQNVPQNFVVPELFFNEMLSVFCRLLKDKKMIVRNLEYLGNLGFHRVGNGRELLSTAAAIAKSSQLRGYDAVYVATAKLLSGVWITADERAHKKIAHLKLSDTLKNYR